MTWEISADINADMYENGLSCQNPASDEIATNKLQTVMRNLFLALDRKYKIKEMTFEEYQDGWAAYFIDNKAMLKVEYRSDNAQWFTIEYQEEGDQLPEIKQKPLEDF